MKHYPTPTLPVPDWIIRHPDYQRLKAGRRHTLTMLAAVAEGDADGNLVVRHVAGRDAQAVMGASEKTFITHVRELESLGFVRRADRGGSHRPTVYVIPGHPTT